MINKKGSGGIGMDEIVGRFSAFLEAQDKQNAVFYALSLLKEGKIGVVPLYEEVLTRSLNDAVCSLRDKRLCVLKEHVKTAIVRTIVECCYPYVIAEREKRCLGGKGSVIVLCPPEEYHDLGARMVADFFTICGFDTVFVGNNTPFEDFYAAADIIAPDYFAISVSNYYNLVAAKRIISSLKGSMKRQFRIIVGGGAFVGRENSCADFGADLCARSFEDIEKIALAGRETGI